MEDFERAALLEAVAEWFSEQYGMEKLPFSPDQVYFYENSVDDLLTGGWIELEDVRWREVGLWKLFGLSLVLAALIALLFMEFAGSWGTGLFMWLAFGGGVLLVFPALAMFHSRTVLVIEGGEDGEGADVEAVFQVARACVNSGLVRWLMHSCADLLLLFAWASYSRGVAQLVVEDYGVESGSMFGASEISARTRRGARLAARIRDRIGPNGLEIMLRKI